MSEISQLRIQELLQRSETNNSIFGVKSVAQLEPRIQLEATNGLRVTDVVTTVGSASGSVVVEDHLWQCSSGTSSGGFGRLRTVRSLRDRAGFGSRFVFSASFTVGVADSYQWAGVFSRLDFLGFGYNGASFGVTRRVPGELEVRTLTLTAAATGAETGTVTLNGTGFPISITSGTVEFNASELAAGFSSSAWDAFAVEDQVVFVASDPEVRGGAYSYSSDGVSAGSLTQDAVGKADDPDSQHFPLAYWNELVPDWIDPQGLNIYEVKFGYAGTANTTFSAYNPNTGNFELLHTIRYANLPLSDAVAVDDPTFKLGYEALSTGSTTDLTVTGASLMGAIEGLVAPFRNSRAASNTQLSVSTEVNVLALRNPIEFSGQVNQQELLPSIVDISIAGNKPAEIKVYTGATITGALWVFEEEDVSFVHLCTTKGAVSGGRAVAAGTVFGSSQVRLDLKELGVRVEPGDTLTISVKVTGGAGDDVGASVSWIED